MTRQLNIDICVVCGDNKGVNKQGLCPECQDWTNQEHSWLEEEYEYEQNKVRKDRRSRNLKEEY